MSRLILQKSYLLLMLLILITLVLDVVFFSSTLEDAQITYRYSLRFSEGYDFGMWNRTGFPVEGFTTFLWMLYLSFFGPNLDSIVYASKITTVFFHLSVIVLFFSLHVKFYNGENHNIFKGSEKIASKAFLFTSIVVAIFLPLSWYATTGMETVLFMTLIAYMIFFPMLTSNIIILSSLSILLVMTRPDGIMFALASPLYYFWITKNRQFITIATVALITFIALAIFRYNHFGYFMPNTYYAKSANTIGLMHLKAGIFYFGAFFITYIYIFIPIILMLISTVLSKKIKEREFFLLLLLGIAIYFIILAKAGADNFSAFPMWRHALNVFPLIIFCMFYSIYSLYPKYSYVLSSIIVLLLFFSPIIFSIPTSQSSFLKEQLSNSIKKFPDFSNDYKNNSLLLWLKNITDENTTIATSLAGELPLTVDAYHLDILGLNDEYIAHNGKFDPNGPTDSKTDMAYVLSKRPNIIEGYMNAKKILKNEELKIIINSRKKMNQDLIENSIFQNEYFIITNAPYETFNRILFIHKDYYEKLNEKVIIKVHPVNKLINAIKNVKEIN